MSVFDDMDRLYVEMRNRSTEALLAEAIQHLEDAQKNIEQLGSVRVTLLILEHLQHRIVTQDRQNS